MAINFDNIPTESPFSIPDPGFYKAKIVKAEMKPAFNKMDPDELNITYELQTLEGNAVGAKLFDKLKESDKPALLFKVGRFCRALGLNLTGNVELKDIAKLIVGKELIVDVEHSDFGGSTRAQVSMFKHKCFYKVSEASEIQSGFIALEDDAADDDLPFVVEPTEGTEEHY